ncbi:MAG: hypothetical protein F6J97_15595 [Leptolyngbya sp. SIO4C1]|nr:hypothetical protein [Leptolyngbya sp. SIO4C1]
MSALSAQLSVTELSQRILEMATTGVYRESLFETFRPVATKRQVREAIALAKQFGLRSDPALRDAELGTYYQVELGKVASFQAAVEQSLQLQAGEDVAARLATMTRIMQTMVRVASGAAIALFLGGGVCVLRGQAATAVIFWSSAVCVGGVWMVQRQLLLGEGGVWGK